MTNEAPAGRPASLPDESQGVSWKLRQHQVYCADRTKYLFGSYRRDDANDPDSYVAAIAAVLTDYPRSIVEYATDPRTGLASIHKWPPNPAEVKEFCDAEMARVARMNQPASRARRFAYEPRAKYPGCRANVFVADTLLVFASCKLWAESGKADACDYEFQPGGIRVALSALENLTHGGCA